MEYAFNTALFVPTDDSTISFAYDKQNDVLLYNPNHDAFTSMPFSIAITHELGHRLDNLFEFTHDLKSTFYKGIATAEKIMLASLEEYQVYSFAKDDAGYISDIFSAVSKQDIFLVGHSEDYWKKQNRRGTEIYANIFSLEVMQDTKKLNYLRTKFPELMKEYDQFIFEVN